MKVVCLQMCSGTDVDRNLTTADSLLKQAADEGAELALLPENFAYMSADDAEKQAIAEPESSSRVLEFLSRQAAELGMGVIGGSVALTSDAPDKIRNACFAFDSKGVQIGSYDKMHLFDVELEHETYCESAVVVAGDKPEIVNVKDWNIGLTICYDLRFPELFRHYSACGCNLYTVPAAFTVPTGMAHWETLLRVRAIENQAYVLAAAQNGIHPGGRETWGHSMIIDPWGDVLAKLDEGVGIIFADLDLQFLHQVRHALPALQHRRMEG
ncbi:MAG: carbon-nitrogen hydrolase family protein [Mariprofundaceae bacterium]